jgi:glycosyltransferase involved in cell wall biosynthesis
MRFCMVSAFYPPYHFGGDAIFVQSLSRVLVAHGHQVEVVHCEDAYRLNGSIAATAAKDPVALTDSDGVVIHRLRSRYSSLSSIVTQQTSRPGLNGFALRRILNQTFDVVNFHNISLIGGLETLPLSRALVNLYTLHEHWLLCPTHSFWKNRRQACDSPQCIRCCLRSGIPPQLWRYSGLRKRSLRSVDALLSPSAYTASRHEEANLGRPIHILPTYSPINPGPAEAHPPAAGRPRFVYVGRVTRSKGVNLLPPLFAGLPQFDLDIVGEGDLLEELRQNYAAYPSIRFLGPREHSQIVPFYSGATAMILPSLAPEVFPLCILEAFACGTPVIVSDAGGSREAVDRSGAGFVYRSDRELLNAVMTLASQPHLRARLATRAREAYERFYNEKRYVAQYLRLIEQIKSTATDRRQELDAALP